MLSSCGEMFRVAPQEPQLVFATAEVSTIRDIVPAIGLCQTKTDRSRKTGIDPISGRELTPFGQGGRAVFLEFFTAVEMAFEIEVVVDGGLNGGELLKTSHRPEPVHDFFSPPQGLM